MTERAEKARAFPQIMSECLRALVEEPEGVDAQAATDVLGELACLLLLRLRKG